MKSGAKGPSDTPLPVFNPRAELPGAWLVVGRRRSGKTELVKDLARTLKPLCFGAVAYAPTMDETETYEPIFGKSYIHNDGDTFQGAIEIHTLTRKTFHAELETNTLVVIDQIDSCFDFHRDFIPGLVRSARRWKHYVIVVIEHLRHISASILRDFSRIFLFQDDRWGIRAKLVSHFTMHMPRQRFDKLWAAATKERFRTLVIGMRDQVMKKDTYSTYKAGDFDTTVLPMALEKAKVNKRTLCLVMLAYGHDTGCTLNVLPIEIFRHMLEFVYEPLPDWAKV